MTFANRLQQRLKLPLPGRSVQRHYSPELCYGRHGGPTGASTRPAAVVLPLQLRGSVWRIVLTKRSPHLAEHAGQISFPGGRVDAGESDEAAALRELSEELGVDPKYVRLLGRLTDVYVFASDFCIRPFVADIDSKVAFEPNQTEVEEVLEIPLSEIRADPNQLQWRSIRRGELEFSAPHIAWRKHRIWGATATILGEFSSLLQEV